MQEYIKIDQHLHLLSQIPALITANLIEETEDYSHTNLVFDVVGKRMLTRWMVSANENVCLSLDLEKLTFQWIDKQIKVKKEIQIAGKTFEQTENEVKSSVTEIGFASNVFTKPLKYELEDYHFRAAEFHPFHEDGLNNWIKIRSLANAACERFLTHLNAAVEVRIWPHHFDTGVYTELANKLGVGFGLAMQDSLVDSPYLYLSGYALAGALGMDNLPKLEHGLWKTGGWNGAVLPYSKLHHLDESNSLTIIDNFMIRSLSWYQQAIL